MGTVMMTLQMRLGHNELNLEDEDRLLVWVNGCSYSIEAKDGKLFAHGPETSAKGIDVYACEVHHRRPLDDDNPDGYLESDMDFVLNNLDACVKFLEGK